MIVEVDSLWYNPSFAARNSKAFAKPEGPGVWGVVTGKGAVMLK
jgi:hypothetical protein